jgi:hypothetical protein
MLTRFASCQIPTSEGNASSCSGPSVLKVAVVVAAAELLRLAGESVEGVVFLNVNDKDTLTAGGAPLSPRPSACLLPLPL